MLPSPQARAHARFELPWSLISVPFKSRPQHKSPLVDCLVQYFVQEIP
jgi:hypothetical protein